MTGACAGIIVPEGHLVLFLKRLDIYCIAVKRMSLYLMCLTGMEIKALQKALVVFLPM